MSELEQRSYDVAMSVEALASAWARTEEASAGSVVIADTEVSGRLRGGVPWTLRGPEALSMAIVMRPNIAPMQEALLWTVAGLAAAEAFTAVTGIEYHTIWPDRVASSQRDEPSCFLNVVVQLRPGAIDHAVFAVRADLVPLEIEASESSRSELVRAVTHAVDRNVERLEQDPPAMLSLFNDRCHIVDELVLAKLLPRGEARGRATAVDSDGFLVLESSTGMLERIAPASLRTLELVDTSDHGNT